MRQRVNVPGATGDVESVEAKMAKPLVTFEELEKEGVLGMGRGGASASAAGTEEQAAEVLDANGMLIQDQKGGAYKKFQVYGARSLKYGGEFLSLLLSQLNEIPTRESLEKLD